MTKDDFFAAQAIGARIEMLQAFKHHIFNHREELILRISDPNHQQEGNEKEIYFSMGNVDDRHFCNELRMYIQTTIDELIKELEDKFSKI